VKVLVIYFRWKKSGDRNTINEHLYSFKRYVKNVQFHYFNAANGIPWYLTIVKYDGVILHYTFLATRWSRDFYRKWRKTIQNLKRISGYKIAIPQDEYAESEALCELFKDYDVRTVFTCFSPEDYEKVYPKEKVNLEHIETVFPGYIDEEAAEEVMKFCADDKKRSIDLGYRARKLPYWLGRQGQIKHEIGQVFKERTMESELVVDICTGEKSVFFGNDWYKFLANCKTVIGCEGGASLLDSTGEIRSKVEHYTREHPDATFEEVERTCFSEKDNNIKLFTLSPRHFECAITQTCQVLMEGEYSGIFSPGVHYIEVNKDYSNIDSVIEKMHDSEYCYKIAENAFQDIVQSGKHTYRVFANNIIAHIKNKVKKDTISDNDGQYFYWLGKYLALREKLEPILVKIFYVWLAFKFLKFGVFKKALNKFKEKQV